MLLSLISGFYHSVIQHSYLKVMSFLVTCAVLNNKTTMNKMVNTNHTQILDTNTKLQNTNCNN